MDGRGKYGISNYNSIGVELAQDTSTGNNAWEWDFHPTTRAQAILVFAYLMKEYNVTLDRVVRHYDASRKSCPGNYMANDWEKWKLWKKDLETYVTTGKLVDSQRGIDYGSDGTATTQPQQKVEPQAKLSIQEVAKQVLRGEWGNGAVRKSKLTKAGYDYNAVQAEVQVQKKATTKPQVTPKEVTYKFLSNVNVRTAAQVNSRKVAMYETGETVNIEGVIYNGNDGYDWGWYDTSSGRRYVALGVANGTRYAVKA